MVIAAGPALVCFPLEDPQFASLANELAVALGGPNGASGPLLRDLLRVLLRERYPDATIVAACAVDGWRGWRVCRDGEAAAKDEVRATG